MEEVVVEKTYRERNIKFILSLSFLNIFSVVVLLYLFSLENFLPTTVDGNYNSLNLSVFATLSFLFLFTLISLITYLLLSLFTKNTDSLLVQIYSTKLGILLTVAIFLSTLLHFFHILNIFWGVGIVVILLVISLVL